ncbi:MAG: PQQ-binding-like beta-propeller repeat protein, partial [Planctomycetota bacterium]
MRHVLTLLFLLGGTVLAADEARVRELIAALAADDTAARDAASAELRTLGDEDESGEVERLLEESSRSKDAEVAARSKEVLDWVRAWERLVLLGGDGGDWSEGAGAMDVATGEYAWRRPYKCVLAMGPRGRDASAYVNSAENGLECVDLRTGEVRWTTKALERGAILDGKYWLGHQGDGLVRISLDTGEVEWRRALVEGHSMGGPWDVPHDARALYVWDDDGLLAVEAPTGKDLWRTKAELLGLGPDGVYVTVPGIDANDAIVKLDPSTGRMLWLRDMPGDGQSIQGFSDGGAATGLVFVENETCHTFALEAATGKVRWDLEAPSVDMWIEPDGSRAWMATFHGLYVVELATGMVIAVPG